MKMYTQPCSSTIICIHLSTMQNGLLFKHKSFVQFDTFKHCTRRNRSSKQEILVQGTRINLLRRIGEQGSK